MKVRWARAWYRRVLALCMVPIVFSLLPACSPWTHSRTAAEIPGAQRGDALSVQQALERRPGTPLVITLRDGSEFRGRFVRQKDGSAGGAADAVGSAVVKPKNLTVRTWDGSLREIPVESIRSVEVPRSGRGEDFGYYVIFGTIIIGGWFLLHSLSASMP